MRKKVNNAYLRGQRNAARAMRDQVNAATLASTAVTMFVYIVALENNHFVAIGTEYVGTSERTVYKINEINNRFLSTISVAGVHGPRLPSVRTGT